MDTAVKRFACTGCGKCCNRSPEVELSEAAALADAFVFRLMFRLYWLPDRLADFLATGDRWPDASTAFYGRKRLLGAFAARSWAVKAQAGGKPVDYVKYLSISALALDTSPGTCSALDGTDCGIYERRPLGCRSVPLHYSRPDASAEADLDAFVATPGYRCDTTDSAPVVLANGRIVDRATNAARAEAMITARRDRRWAETIARHLKGASYAGLPTLQEIEANAGYAATTTSMRLGWQIAVDAGLLPREQCDRLVGLQLDAIDRELAFARCSREVRETLIGMRTEYQHSLDRFEGATAVG